MINRNTYKEIILNFLKEKSQILALENKDEFVFELGHSRDLIDTEAQKDKFYDIVLLENSFFDTETISTYLKKSGHFISLQKEISEKPSFNLENQAELLEKSGFRIVKCDQDYDDLGKNIFYILAKKM